MKTTTVDFRTTSRDLMDVKNCYNIYGTESALKFLFESQYSDLKFVRILSADPDPINTDTVLVRVEAETQE